MKSQICLTIITAFLLLSAGLVAPALGGSTKTLQFKNGKFKVLQLTDLHYGSNKFDNVYTSALVNFLLTFVQPDFTAVTGDVISGFQLKTTSEFLKLWKQFQVPFSIQKQEYGVALGNHDSQGSLNRTQIIENDKLSPFSHSKEMLHAVSPGSNYYVLVNSSLVPQKVALVLWFFDTHDTGCLFVDFGYGCVEEDQINWFLQTHNELTNTYGQDVLHVAFLHIPPPEYMYMYNTAKVYGMKQENVCCPQINSGFVAALAQKQVRAVFAGHDHDNDYGGFYYNVELVYGRKAGFNIYGPPIGVLRGGRALEFRETLANGRLNVTLSHRVVQGDGTYQDNGEPISHFIKQDKCS